jgi:photosystem II stability/assembly factor-like uncharacterized protein
MKKILGLLVVTILVLTICAVGAEMKGSISDKMCGADHQGQDPTKCTLSCVEHGSPFVLVVSKEKILDIENQKDAKIAAELKKHAGHNVTVTGTMSKDGKSVKIDKITM